MLERYIGYHRDHRRLDRIGAVERASHSNLQYHRISLLLPEEQHGNSCEHLESARMIFHLLGFSPDCFC